MMLKEVYKFESKMASQNFRLLIKKIKFVVPHKVISKRTEKKVNIQNKWKCFFFKKKDSQAGKIGIQATSPLSTSIADIDFQTLFINSIFTFL